MIDPVHMLITWTTYGTWLPGDSRGWRRRESGVQVPRPLLERWCRAQMAGEVVLLRAPDRATVEDAIGEHCQFRGWVLHAVSPRTNHVHVVISADKHPTAVRDQLKANCTRRLREQPEALNVPRMWARGGDCELLSNEEHLEAAVLYVTEAQDKKHLDK